MACMARVYFLLRHPIIRQKRDLYSIAKIGWALWPTGWDGRLRAAHVTITISPDSTVSIIP